MMSKDIEKYFTEIESEVERAYKLAGKARKKGFDPEDKVDIPLARNMAERVEGLMSAATDKLAGTGFTKRIHELEKKYGALAWEVALIIAGEVAEEKFCKFSDMKQAMEIGIRAGFTYHTLGIVSAPLEGFVELTIKKRKDGKEYLALKFAGPIRGAGGTAASVCVIIGDYVRKRMGYSEYDPDEDEINRYVTELADYHERITNLQYNPSDKELRFLVKNLPVEVDGDPTEKIEVSNYKDLPRVGTNRIRSGVCLVVSMIALKAPKIWKRLSVWGSDFNIDWTFLQSFLEIKKESQKEKSGDLEKNVKLTPNPTYISDLVAGRPVLTHPMREGGFRLRYGRSRLSGFSAGAIHPATMRLLDNYIATGTQLKVERPGKAAAITPCNSIEGPIIKLKNGSVIAISSETEAKQYLKDLEEVLFLGDFLFSYGDFSENGHKLVPAGYCEEWWVQEVEKATVNMFGTIDHDKLAEHLDADTEKIAKLLENAFNVRPTAAAAIKISLLLDVPLHPKYTYHWADIKKDGLIKLISWLINAEIKKDQDKILKIVGRIGDGKKILEQIGIPHTVSTTEFIVIEREDALAILANLNIESEDSMGAILDKVKSSEKENALQIVNEISKIKIRDKSGTFIGARMGRPEKAKMRKLTGSPHVLFPVGTEGGRLRCFQSALEAGKIMAELPIYSCSKCGETIYGICERCGRKTKQLYSCPVCGITDKSCSHEYAHAYREQALPIKHYFTSAVKKLHMRAYPDLIKGVRGTSNKDHIPENLAKGILRAKHNVYVNKDGTTRYDMTEIPLTHFTPKEIDVGVEKLKSLGYHTDCKGRELENNEQLLELKPQDLILPASQNSLDESADQVLVRVAKCVDDMLISLYGQDAFYNIRKREDLVGQLVIGLAPHISAGMIGRIIGFSETLGCYAHPLWHAALRRDCDGDEACVMLLMDALLNFSRQFLPDSRGGRTMDAPLVLTSKLVPAEVDDMAHGIDVNWRYPLEFYEAAAEYKNPWDVKIEQLKDRLNTDKQYEDFGFTHAVSNINIGIKCSAYKTLPSMQEKLDGQMNIARKVRAVDEIDVAKLVIEKHFLKDIKGNLRKFSMQQFRCVKCNEKFRRVPLIGKCTKCGGKIIFTISEGSVVKYLEPTQKLGKDYALSPYLMQTIELTQQRIEEVFGKEKETQTGLKSWVS